jgi:hypothetical protein
MNFGTPALILAIFAMSYGAWVLVTWIRARHGYPLENEWGGMCARGDKEADQAAKALVAENQQLKETVEQLEERLKVLERIATDPSRRLAEDIDNLR